MIRLLAEEREVLRPVFENEFQSEVPETSQANLTAWIDEQKNITAFAVSEVLIRLGLLWTHPRHRGKEGAKNMKAVLEYIRESIPKGASVVVFSTESRFDRLCRKFGMREVEGKIFRLDF